MDDTRHFDVAVIGAGAAGLWACLELTAAGVDVLLVSAPDSSGYASTRNQGWLHSGALFALFDAQRNAEECRVGSRIIRSFADGLVAGHDRPHPHASPIVHDLPFRYVFADSDDLEARASQCARAGIEVTPEDASDLSDLFGRTVQSLRAPDGVTDNSRLLRALATQARGRGLVTAQVADLPSLDVDPLADGSWRISGQGVRATVRQVVLASGPLGPRLVDRIDRRHGLDQRPALEVTRTTVLCLHETLSDAALICIDGGPHVVPFRSVDGRRGATVCVPFDNAPADPESVHVPPTRAEQGKVLDALDSHMPGLAAVVGTGGGDATWYACQKLIPSASAGRPDWRHNVLEALSPGLFLAYAGKFTTAPLLGRQVAEACTGTAPGSSAPGSAPLGDVHVASQPFTRAATHQLVVRGERLHTVPRSATSTV